MQKGDLGTTVYLQRMTVFLVKFQIQGLIINYKAGLLFYSRNMTIKTQNMFYHQWLLFFSFYLNLVKLRFTVWMVKHICHHSARQPIGVQMVSIFHFSTFGPDEDPSGNRNVVIIKLVWHGISVQASPLLSFTEKNTHNF